MHQQMLSWPNNDFIARDIEREHEQGFAHRHFEPAPLTDGIMDDALMAAKDTPVYMNNIARLAGPGAQALDDIAIFAIGHEADVLTVGLVGSLQTKGTGQLSGGAFMQTAKRKAQMGQLFFGG